MYHGMAYYVRVEMMLRYILEQLCSMSVSVSVSVSVSPTPEVHTPPRDPTPA